MPKKIYKVLMKMKAAKLGWAGAGQEQGKSMARARQEQKQSRGSRAEQGRSWG